MRATVITVSDRVSRGEAEDESGAVLEEGLRAEGFDVERRVVPDDREAIFQSILDACDGSAVVLTTGGTGFAQRDVTPEATEHALDRAAPGIAEAIRADAIAKTSHGLLSRGLAGMRGQTLVVNLPGSPGGARDGFEVLRPALAHGVKLLVGEETAHRQT